MHIPDGFLESRVWIPLAAVSAGAIAVSSRRVSKDLDEKKIPLMGVLAAFVFAAQMVNFPVGGGTSGHLMGGVLIAAIVGPFSALLMMATILILQALLFQDGGITALGANIFNMGVVGAGLGYLAFKGLNIITGNIKFSVIMASWLSVVLASCVTAFELSISGIAPLKMALPAMAGIHALIGIGEGAVTIAALELIGKANNDAVLISKTAANEKISHKAAWIWLGISLLIAVILAPFASELPDGLEKVADSMGFIDRESSLISSPLSDYHIPGMDGGTSTAFAGLVGAAISFALVYVIVKSIQRKRK